MLSRLLHIWVGFSLVALLVLTMVSGVIVSSTTLAQGTPTVDPIEARDAFMPGLGVTSELIGQANVDLGAMSDPTLRLERIVLPVGTILPTQRSSASEILYVDAGAAVIADGFGFTTETVAGQNLIFNPGTAYDLLQAGDVPVSVLRVRVVGIDEPLLDTASNESSSGSTPVVSEPIITTIIDHRLTDAQASEVTYYLARIALSSGAETGEQSHEGPLGIYVGSGVLTALSPSGVTGTLNTGASAVLPANVPLIGSNQGTDETVVFLVGLGTQGDPLIVEITPMPSPALVPTPTAVPTTPVDMIFQLGEAWQTESASLRVSLIDIGAFVRLKAVYTNISESRLDFITPTDFISIYDDTQSAWTAATSTTSTIDLAAGRRIILDPGESFEWDFVLSLDESSVDGHIANVFISFRRFGAIEHARWGFTLYDGRALRLPPDAVDPQEGHGATISAGPPSSGDPPNNASLDEAGLSALLPTADQVPPALTDEINVTRTQEDVVTSLGGGRPAEANLEEWGWSGNVDRAFQVSDPGAADPAGTIYLGVSVTGFGSALAAEAALPFFADILISGGGYTELDAPDIGDEALLLTMANEDGSTNVTLYVRDGSVLYRILGASPAGNPMQDVLALAIALIGS